VIGRGVAVLEHPDVASGGDHFLFDNHPQERVYQNEATGERFVVLHATHFYQVFEEIMKRELEVIVTLAIGSIGAIFGDEEEEAV